MYTIALQLCYNLLWYTLFAIHIFKQRYILLLHAILLGRRSVAHTLCSPCVLT